MAIRIGDEAPDFTAATTEGTIHFHEWIADKWAILFSHPKDFTPVCTTELGYMARLKPEFDKRNTKVIGLSADAVSDHESFLRSEGGVRARVVRAGEPERNGLGCLREVRVGRRVRYVEVRCGSKERRVSLMPAESPDAAPRPGKTRGPQRSQSLETPRRDAASVMTRRRSSVGAGRLIRIAAVRSPIEVA